MLNQISSCPCYFLTTN